MRTRIPSVARRSRWVMYALAMLVAGCGVASGTTVRAPSRRAARKTVPAGPLAKLRLYVDPENPAARQIITWRTQGMDADASALEAIATQPTPTWLTGAPSAGRTAATLVSAASRAGDTAELVIYDLPGRDCGSYSSGGAPSGSAYLAWVRTIARGIGGRSAIVIMEPDAINQAAENCLPNGAASARYRLLRQAVSILKSDPGVRLYLDAGHTGWLAPKAIVDPLRAAGIDHADGFALNVANFQTTSASIAYGQRLSRRLGGRHFVIDTGRNGVGPPSSGHQVNTWCNPPGRALGTDPTTHTGEPLVDAYLWVKYPGESDGNCHPGDPVAGAWWPTYALSLVETARSAAGQTSKPAAHSLEPTPAWNSVRGSG